MKHLHLQSRKGVAVVKLRDDKCVDIHEKQDFLKHLKRFFRE